jgi:hypothetical protein
MANAMRIVDEEDKSTAFPPSPEQEALAAPAAMTEALPSALECTAREMLDDQETDAISASPLSNTRTASSDIGSSAGQSVTPLSVVDEVAGALMPGDPLAENHVMHRDNKELGVDDAWSGTPTTSSVEVQLSVR